MHPHDGQLKARLDGETSHSERDRIDAHLATCTRCAARFQILREQADRVRATLESIAPQPEELAAASTEEARARLAARASHVHESTAPPFLANLTKESVMTWLKSVRARPVWAAGIAALVLALAMTFPPVRAVAVGILSLFRVQRVAVAPVDPGDLPERLGRSAQLESMLSDQVDFVEYGDPVEVANAAEAGSQSDFPVRLPGVLGEPRRLTVAPGGQANITVDVTRVRGVLREIERTEIEIPDGLDGTLVTVEVPRSVRAIFGDCSSPRKHAESAGADAGRDGAIDDEAIGHEVDEGTEGMHPRLPPDCTVLVQMPSPRVSAPPGLPIDQIGEAFLELMGMPPDEAQRFSRTVDWSTTLVVPIPRYSTSYQHVAVDGVSGTLIHHNVRGRRSSMLIWVKDGIIYSLIGAATGAEALEIANSLR